MALGSTLASIITSSDVSLTQGAFAFGLLIGIQFVVAKATVRFKTLESLINGEPVLLFHSGKFLHEAMARARVTEAEVNAKARQCCKADLSEVAAVVLETNGELSIITNQKANSPRFAPVK